MPQKRREQEEEGGQVPYSGNDAFRVPRTPHAYRVRLLCGHWVRLRLHPLRPEAKYMCTLGLGCAYDQSWVEWVSIGSDVSMWNPKFKE
jgi:hypothetical protein